MVSHTLSKTIDRHPNSDSYPPVNVGYKAEDSSNACCKNSKATQSHLILQTQFTLVISWFFGDCTQRILLLLRFSL